MRYLYTLLYYLLLPSLLLRSIWRSRRQWAHVRRWQERLGYCHALNMQGVIWIHAVSVGETLAALPLIKALQQQYPQQALLVTTTTATGSDRVQAALGQQVGHVYAPYDVPSCLKRFLNQVQPRLVIIMETELWPNLLALCDARRIPVILANARLSARSAAGYAKVPKITGTMLQQLAAIAAQTPADADRFIRLGMEPQRVVVTGNLKFDIEISSGLLQQAAAIRAAWGQRLVWIAASTHEGEDEQVLAAFRQLKHRFPQLLLILVPRHPERFDRVAALCQKQNYVVVRRSLMPSGTQAMDIYLGDTLGELVLLYACADVAFVGGSLVATGGHNMLEPAVLGLATVSGPHVFNFSAIATLLQQAGALSFIQDVDSLVKQVSAWLSDEPARTRAGSAGQQVVAANRGALAKQLALIAAFLSVG